MAGIRNIRWWFRFAIIAIGITAGIGVGVGFYTFQYAKGASYLSNDPRACANCHIMADQFEGWAKSSHRNVATCNDCHTPKGYIPKYLTKASNGFWHSYAFTTGDFHEPIRIKPKNREIAEASCRKCHAGIIHAIEPMKNSDNISCVHCHRSVGHPH